MAKEIKSRQEDRMDSSRTVLRFMKLYNTKTKEHRLIREALFEDLYGKAKGLNQLKRSLLLTPGLISILPDKSREMFDDGEFGNIDIDFLSDKLKDHKNIGIITVLKKELEGVLLALGLQKDSQPNKYSKVFRYWFSEIERDDQESLSVVATMVGEARNVPTAIAVDHLLNHFTVDLLVFIGIAGGSKQKVGLGDVVVSDRVYDYEHVRSEFINDEIVEKPRPLYIELNKKIKNDLSTYDENFMISYFNELIKNVSKEDLPNENLKSIKPRFHFGTSMAGERLIADGSIREFREKVDERIRLCDQEDSGFALACNYEKIDWCIFRGISDYADISKNKNWHTLASISAAAAAVTFLKHFYILPNMNVF